METDTRFQKSQLSYSLETDCLLEDDSFQIIVRPGNPFDTQSTLLRWRHWGLIRFLLIVGFFILTIC